MRKLASVRLGSAISEPIINLFPSKGCSKYGKEYFIGCSGWKYTERDKHLYLPIPSNVDEDILTKVIANDGVSTLQSPTDSAGVQRTPLGPTGLQECHILSHICHTYVTICHIFLLHFVTFCHVLSRFVTFWSPPESGESGFYTIILSKTGLIWIIY